MGVFGGIGRSLPFFNLLIFLFLKAPKSQCVVTLDFLTDFGSE